MLDATNNPRGSRINWVNVSTVLSAAILIAAEVFGAAFAGGWALYNLFLSSFFSLIGLEAYGMHITQGFGNFGGRGGSGPNEQSFIHLDGEPAKTELMDGIDTTWNRVRGGAEIAQASQALIDGFNGNEPSAVIPKLLALRAKLGALPSDPVVNDKRAHRT